MKTTALISIALIVISIFLICLTSSMKKRRVSKQIIDSTLYRVDTIRLEPDTVVMYDTIVMHDTLYIYIERKDDFREKAIFAKGLARRY